MIRKWEITNEDVRKKCINEIIARIQEIEDASTVGAIAAQDIIDIVSENLAPEIYNLGIQDAKKTVQGKFQDIEVDLDLLEINS
jgi:uncharacterized protein (DUF2164 family)